MMGDVELIKKDIKPKIIDIKYKRWYIQEHF
jgi:hypothetical protein